MYPAFKVAIFSAASPVKASPPYELIACVMSAQAAMMLLSTMRPKLIRAIPVTEPPNHSTSPYAMRMMVKFLKMVYTGMLRNWRALIEV